MCNPGEKEWINWNFITTANRKRTWRLTLLQKCQWTYNSVSFLANPKHGYRFQVKEKQKLTRISRMVFEVKLESWLEVISHLKEVSLDNPQLHMKSDIQTISSQDKIRTDVMKIEKKKKDQRKRGEHETPHCNLFTKENCFLPILPHPSLCLLHYVEWVVDRPH